MNEVELSADGGCPRCGSTAFTAVKPVKGAPLTADRECKGCETSYLTIPALVPGVVQAAMYVGGIVLILGGIMVVVLPFVTEQAPGSPRPTFQVGAIFSLIVGFQMFNMPRQTQQQREKKLQDYKSSAPPGAPPPVELPAWPAAVSISILYGAMSLIAPLVSALLTVVIFGSTAIVAGAVAVLQGHAKGLIGVLLGMAGLAVWGLVFFIFMQH